MKIDKMKLILSMFIFGTIGLVRRYIPLSSSVVALSRGIIGTLILLVWHFAKREHFDWQAIRKNAWKLIISGAVMGFNWILLFEAYRYTTVSVATICYYMAPVIVILVSPVLFKEKITLKKGLCQLAAVVGIVLVSGVTESGVSGMKGIFFGLGAAALYACVIILNKKMSGISGNERTVFQMASCVIALLPYVLLTEDVTAIDLTGTTICMLLIAGILHTGIAYVLYFGSVAKVPAQSAAILSYIDPVIAVILSALVLKEGMTAAILIGVVLVIGGAMLSEIGE